MFPDVDVNALQKGVGLYVDILDTIASLLLRNDVVGKVSDSGQWEWNFRWEWEEKLNSNGEVTIGDCNTSDSFRLAEDEVRRMYPHLEVYLLYIIMSTDKTQLCKFGNADILSPTYFLNIPSFFYYRHTFIRTYIFL